MRHKIEFDCFRAALDRQLRKAKEEFYERKFREAEGSPKKSWRVVFYIPVHILEAGDVVNHSVQFWSTTPWMRSMPILLGLAVIWWKSL